MAEGDPGILLPAEREGVAAVGRILLSEFGDGDSDLLMEAEPFSVIRWMPDR